MFFKNVSRYIINLFCNALAIVYDVAIAIERNSKLQCEKKNYLSIKDWFISSAN